MQRETLEKYVWKSKVVSWQRNPQWDEEYYERSDNTDSRHLEAIFRVFLSL